MKFKSCPLGKKSPWLLGHVKTVTVSGTESSLMLDMFWSHFGQIGCETGTDLDLGITESMFLVVSRERKFAVYGERK